MILPSDEIGNPTEVENWKNFGNGVHQLYGDSNNPSSNWVERRRNPGEPKNNEDNFFEPNTNQPETNFGLYEDETDGNAHDITEVGYIPDLDLFLSAELLLPNNWYYMQGSKALLHQNYHN